MPAPVGWGDIGLPLEKPEYIHQDRAWLQLLPEGSSVISAVGYGGSYWSQTGRIDVRLRQGSTESYLIKISEGLVGKKMAEGEYESMKALYSILPELLPRPIGWGLYETDNNVAFYMCEFVELYDELPDVVDFCAMVAELHRRSMKPENSKYGFHVPTCNETVEQYSQWSPSWECFFTESLRRAFEVEEGVHEPDPEILKLKPALFDKVIPRLLRPLETEGRKIHPCLVHGDLWDGNIGVRARTGKPVIFDASALWAHNEYELHIWRGSRYRIGRTFMKEYFHHFPISPPEDDWADRNLLYSLMADLHSSTHFKHTERFRAILLQSMRELVSKYPSGYEGPAKRKDLGQQQERRDLPIRATKMTLGGYSNQ